MVGRDDWTRGDASQRVGEIVEVTVNNVKLLELGRQLAEHHCPEGREIRVRRCLMPQGLLQHRHEPRRCLGIAGSKEGHVMTTAYELLGERRYDPLGAS